MEVSVSWNMPVSPFGLSVLLDLTVATTFRVIQQLQEGWWGIHGSLSSYFAITATPNKNLRESRFITARDFRQIPKQTVAALALEGASNTCCHGCGEEVESISGCQDRSDLQRPSNEIHLSGRSYLWMVSQPSL